MSVQYQCRTDLLCFHHHFLFIRVEAGKVLQMLDAGSKLMLLVVHEDFFTFSPCEYSRLIFSYVGVSRVCILMSTWRPEWGFELSCILFLQTLDDVHRKCGHKSIVHVGSRAEPV
jgi:hypothetical protein